MVVGSPTPPALARLDAFSNPVKIWPPWSERKPIPLCKPSFTVSFQLPSLPDSSVPLSESAGVTMVSLALLVGVPSMICPELCEVDECDSTVSELLEVVVLEVVVPDVTVLDGAVLDVVVPVGAATFDEEDPLSLPEPCSLVLPEFSSLVFPEFCSLVLPEFCSLPVVLPEVFPEVLPEVLLEVLLEDLPPKILLRPPLLSLVRASNW